jgi:DNA-binding transcriptional ArsR family regulator
MEYQTTLSATPYPIDAADTGTAVRALAALAQPTRLAIFRRLVEFAPDGLTAGTIASALDLAPATLSFHLKELAAAGLVSDQREGRHIRYRADLAAMNALIGYLTDNCCRGRGRLVDATACASDCAPATCSPTPSPTRKPR